MKPFRLEGYSTEDLITPLLKADWEVHPTKKHRRRFTAINFSGRYISEIPPTESYIKLRVTVSRFPDGAVFQKVGYGYDAAHMNLLRTVWLMNPASIKIAGHILHDVSYKEFLCDPALFAYKLVLEKVY